MGLETATYVSGLTATNPPGTDPKSQGDDHLRLIKAVLQATFPNAAKAFYFPETSSKSANFSVVAADMHKQFLLDASVASITITLPTLGVGDAGWTCSFRKIQGSANPIFIQPASGTLWSGDLSNLAWTRRAIYNVPFFAFWSGTNWHISRCVDAPVGSVIPTLRATAPVGFEMANGVALSSTANYPDYFAVAGTLSTPDLRGRAPIGHDTMGGSAAGRITTAMYGVPPILLAGGGFQSNSLTTDLIPELAVTGNVVITDPGHTHTVSGVIGGGTAGAAGGTTGAVSSTTGSSTTGITAALSGAKANAGGVGGDFSVVQPGIIMNWLLVVE